IIHHVNPLVLDRADWRYNYLSPTTFYIAIITTREVCLASSEMAIFSTIFLTLRHRQYSPYVLAERQGVLGILKCILDFFLALSVFECRESAALANAVAKAKNPDIDLSFREYALPVTLALTAINIDIILTTTRLRSKLWRTRRIDPVSSCSHRN